MLSVQAQVKGAQLLEYKVEKLGVNPCIDEKDSYYYLICYYYRGKVILTTKKSKEVICIGNLKKNYQKPWYKRFANHVTNFFIN